jgi:D-alanine-D-alanine ligase
MKNFPIRSIGITFNLKKKGTNDDRHEEYDEIETIEALKTELGSFGFKPILLEQNKNFTKDIIKAKPDFVLNIAEGIGDTRARESQVPCILESLNIPYSGSDPLSLGITLYKYLTNCILKSRGIPVPLMHMARCEKEIKYLKGIFVTKTKRLFIVKPRWEGSSKGIFLNSVVDNFKKLKERAVYIFSKYRQPALIEEFLEKEEITVGICGNKLPRILGMMKISALDKTQKFFLYSQENKRDWREKIKYEPQASIPRKTQRLIENYAIKSFMVLELRDIARIDFRLDKYNAPKIIDINPLPGLSPHYSDLPIIYRLKGKNYTDLIKNILKEAFLRYGLKWEANLLN